MATITATIPALSYALDALAPQISAETMQYHYGKHLQGYIDNLNRLVVGSKFEGQPLEEIVRHSEGAIFNNAAQTWNHIFFFDSLAPEPKKMPTGELAEAIERDFGSLQLLRRDFNRAASDLFGSGWVWLVADRYNRLLILSTQNAATPIREELTPLLTLDVWEHAYYIDYRNRRTTYIDAVWERIDWRKAEARYK